MDPLTLILVLLVVALLIGAFAGRIDPLAVIAVAIVLIVVLYAVPRIR